MTLTFVPSRASDPGSARLYRAVPVMLASRTFASAQKRANAELSRALSNTTNARVELTLRRLQAHMLLEVAIQCGSRRQVERQVRRCADLGFDNVISLTVAYERLHDWCIAHCPTSAMPVLREFAAALELLHAQLSSARVSLTKLRRRHRRIAVKDRASQATQAQRSSLARERGRAAEVRALTRPRCPAVGA